MNKQTLYVTLFYTSLCAAALGGFFIGSAVMRARLDERARLDAIAIEQALDEAVRWELKYEETLDIGEATGTGVVR